MHHSASHEILFLLKSCSPKIALVSFWSKTMDYSQAFPPPLHIYAGRHSPLGQLWKKRGIEKDLSNGRTHRISQLLLKSHDIFADTHTFPFDTLRFRSCTLTPSHPPHPHLWGAGGDHLFAVVEPGEEGLYVPGAVGAGRVVRSSASQGVVHSMGEREIGTFDFSKK